jgi:hypothetical protein
MGLPEAISLACLYSAHFFLRAALMRRSLSNLNILLTVRKGISSMDDNA